MIKQPVSPLGIIGGRGVQGTQVHTAARTCGDSRLKDSTRSFDRCEIPGEVLRRQIEQSLPACWQGRVWRSGWGGHIDPRAEDALKECAKREGLDTNTEYPPISAIFRQMDSLCHELHLREQLHLATVQNILFHNGVFQVETPQGVSQHQNLVLSLGQPPLRYPSWSIDFSDKPLAGIQHIFDSQYDPYKFNKGDDVTIIGGGITAVQHAILLAKYRGVKVTVLSRSPIINEDTLPDSFMVVSVNKALKNIHNTDDRIDYVNRHNFSKAVPGFYYDEFMQMVEDGDITYIVDEIENVEANKSSKTIAYQLKKSKIRTSTQNIVLATGFDNSQWASQPIFQQVIQNLGLKLSERYGAPLLSTNLHWQSSVLPENRRIYVVGGGLTDSILGSGGTFMAGGLEAAKRVIADLVHVINLD